MIPQGLITLAPQPHALRGETMNSQGKHRAQPAVATQLDWKARGTLQSDTEQKKIHVTEVEGKREFELKRFEVKPRRCAGGRSAVRSDWIVVLSRCADGLEVIPTHQCLACAEIVYQTGDPR